MLHMKHVSLRLHRHHSKAIVYLAEGDKLIIPVRVYLIVMSPISHPIILSIDTTVTGTARQNPSGEGFR